MKEINKPEDVKQSEIHAKAEIDKTTKYHGSVKPHPNQRCFEYNKATGEIKEASIKTEAQVAGDKAKIKRSINVNDNCIYIVALNKDNALRKLKKTHRI